MNVSKRFLLFAVALVVCFVAAPITSVEAAATTRLTGTLTIDFTVDETNPVLPEGFTFTVADQVKVAGIPIPAAIRGGTFELNEECDNTESGDTTAGRALLRLKNATQGTVFSAFVTSGAANCLFDIGASRVGGADDPFKDGTPTENFINSLIAEGSVWFAQILQADPDINTDDNEFEMRDFFSIPPARTEIRFRVTTIESSQVGSGNRDGSADGINSSAVDLIFKNP